MPASSLRVQQQQPEEREQEYDGEQVERNDKWETLSSVGRLLTAKGAVVNKANHVCRVDHLEVAQVLLAHGAKGNENTEEYTKFTEFASFNDHTVLSTWLSARV